MRYVEYLSDPERRETEESISKKLKVTKETLRKWRSDPLVVQSAFKLSVIRLGAEIPKILQMLKEKSLEDRDITACKLFLQQIEKVTEIPESGISPDEALKMVKDAVLSTKENGDGK